MYTTDRAAKFERNFKRSIKIDGVVYPSVEEASREIKTAQTVIRRRLVDDKCATWQESEHTTMHYSIDGQLFDTFQDILDAGLASNRKQIRDRLRTKKSIQRGLK